MTSKDQHFLEEDESEDEWDKHLYENITQKKCGSNADDEIENTDDLEAVDNNNNNNNKNFI